MTAKLENEINNLIVTKGYDERLVSFIKAFFSYNIDHEFWDEDTAKRKLELYKERIASMDVAEIGSRKVVADIQNKLLVFSKDSIKYIDDEDKIELLSEAFEEQELITKDTDIDLSTWKSDSNYEVENLKYYTNQNEKERILKMLSNALNLKPEDFYNIRDVIEEKISQNQNNKEESDYWQDIRTTIMPAVSDVVAEIKDNGEKEDKGKSYFKLYSISLLALKLRKVNTEREKAFKKGQYENLKEEFKKISEEYGLDISNLKECVIDSTFTVSVEKIEKQLQEYFKDVKADERVKGKQVNIDNINEIDEEVLNQITEVVKAHDQSISDEYLEEKASTLEKRYGQTFGPFASEYLKRSVKVYNWTKDELNKKFNNFLMNVKEYKIEKNEEKDTARVAYWSLGKIVLDKDMSFITPNNLVGTLMHEQEHATDSTEREDIYMVEGFLPIYNTLNEYATEIGAMHLVGNKRIYDDDLCFTHRMGGYEELRYAGSMISAALGISEFEFAKLRDKGLDEFFDYMEENYWYLDTVTIVDDIENLFEDIINAPSMLEKREYSEAYARIYNLSKEILRNRIEYEEQNIQDKDKEKFDMKTQYELAKIAYNMKEAKREFKLKNRYMRPILGDFNEIKDDAIVFDDEKEEWLSLIEELYPEKNLHFDNKELEKIARDKIKHPIREKLKRFFSKNKAPMLPEAIDESRKDKENARNQFVSKYIVGEDELLKQKRENELIESREKINEKPKSKGKTQGED